MEFELNNIDTDTRDHNIMEKEDEFLHTYFNQVSQLCYEKAKEHVEKAKEPKGVATPWNTFLHHLQQLIIAEKSYIEIGFLQNKHKSFLRKDPEHQKLLKQVNFCQVGLHHDAKSYLLGPGFYYLFADNKNSLRSVYETMRNDFKKLEDNSKPAVGDNRVHRGCINIIQFLNARISLIEIYEKIYSMTSNKHFQYNEIASHIESVIQSHLEGFSDISMTPIKAVFCLEGEILEKLFKALSELQKLQFLSSLTLIHAAHTRLIAWENKIQPREVWKLGIFKNNPVPALFQWIQKLKSAVLSKFSLYFHDILAKQTTSSDMKYLCSKLQQDYYQKMIAFLKKYDASSVILMSDNEVNCDITDYESFPIIVSYPPRNIPRHNMVLKMIYETSHELTSGDKIIYKFSSQEQSTCILTTVEPNIYLVIVFESKKTEKDTFINNFIVDLCTNLNCTKILSSLKSPSK